MTFRNVARINIAGLTPVEDPWYRYKMPAIVGNNERSGNTTVLPNITDVAQSLHRSPGEIAKFFGIELGARAQYNFKTNRAVVAGRHTDRVLQDLMHRYIERFVLCPHCGLPETEYKIRSAAIYHKCAACGAKEMVDMSHKLCNYILAENKKDQVASGKAAAKDATKDDKKKSKKKEIDGSDNDEKKKKDKMDKKKPSSFSSQKKHVSDGPNGENGGGGIDYIKDALVGKDANVFDENLNWHGSHSDNSDDDRASEAGVDDAGARLLAVDATKAYMAANPTASDKEVADFVTNQQITSALTSQERIYIAVHAVFTPNFFKNKEAQKYAPLLSRVTNGNRIMERHMIGALEALCADKPKNFAVLIKQLYDEDALDEATILEWANEGRSEYTREEVDEETRAALRGLAEPLVVWLHEADSDDDDEDED